MDEHDPTRETLLDTLSERDSSPLQKYQEMYVGSRSLAELAKYELLTFFLSSMPGALGFLLRKSFYRILFASAGRGVFIGPHVTLRCPRNIDLGSNVFIDNNAVLDAKGTKSHISLGDSVLIGKDSILSCFEATIEIGQDASIGPNCFIRAGIGPIKMGSHITIGAHTVIVSGNPGYERTDIPMKHQLGSTVGVTVGDDVWIGVGARIVDGVTIASGSVIGAGAVVIEDVSARTIVAGVPAKTIGQRRAYEAPEVS